VDFNNSRKYRRYHKELKVRLENNPGVLFIQNISRGGFFLKIGHILEIGSEHNFVIQFDKQVYSFVGKVRWTRAKLEKGLPIGNGLEFVEPGAAFCTALEDVLEEIDLTYYAENIGQRKPKN